MLAAERSERVSITTGVAIQNKDAAGDEIDCLLTGGACHYTRCARSVVRYHRLLKGHPLGILPPCLYSLAAPVVLSCISSRGWTAKSEE